jgi:hypothetical protein
MWNVEDLFFLYLIVETFFNERTILLCSGNYTRVFYVVENKTAAFNIDIFPTMIAEIGAIALYKSLFSMRHI